MRVQKRNGEFEDVKFDKVTARIEKLSHGLDVSPVTLAQKVLSNITDGIKTSEIDEITADIAVSMPTGDYPQLAARIIASNLHKTCPPTFAEAMDRFYNGSIPYPSSVHKVCVYPERDLLFDFFGLKTLMKMYLKKDIETPQYMLMRVALAICGGDPISAQETYDAMSLKYYTHATPTLFNAGTKRPQCSSCFVEGTPVFTVNRGQVPIEDIQIGDIVITHLGNHKPVVQIHKNRLDNRQLFSVKVYKTPKIEVTGNHRFWSITKEQLEWGEAPRWNSIEQLRVGDWIKKHYDDDRLQKNQRANTSLVIDNTTFLRINEKMKLSKTPDYVYTLGVKDDHSYTVNGLVAENCYLVSMKSDSIDGIYDTKKECALISRMAGGIGLHIHNIRAKGSKIYGTDGFSDGIIPMLRTLNADARYVNQAGRRKGSYAIYLEPWHADIFPFLELRLNQGDEEARCRDLFTALWIPDLFMKRLEANEDWSLFCPNEAPGLSDVYGEEFERLYIEYERRGLARTKVPIQKLWLAIIKSQVETGTPYMLYKDACNEKSNQKNLGTIKSSNLCVAPETWIRTRQGDRVISLLENKEVEVWNGHEWSTVMVRKTSDRAHLIEVYIQVRIKGGSMTMKKLVCTPQHKFILPDGSRIDASNLETGMDLMSWTDDLGYEKEACVSMVTDLQRVSPTYCFTEPLRHQGVFNGILTGQCTEIIEYTDSETTAVCNLASIGLPTFVHDGRFDYEKLEEITRLVTRNLNKVIDYTFYPVETAMHSNLKYRPIGIGVQGLADTYAMLKMNFGEGTLNRDIFETIYYAALSESMKLAQLCGKYEGFDGSPASMGQLQFDFWNVTPTDRYDWNALKADIQKYGLRNSLLVAPMPTATTSQMFGFNECFEPFTSNIYLRRTLAGEFVVVNKYLVQDLKDLGLWSPSMRTQIIRDGGSIANISEIPDHIRERYKTAWEISPKVTIDMARERGAYICQSQSMNIFVDGVTNAKLSSIHMYAWKSGLKTGMYYLRTRPRTKAIQFTVDPACTMCSS